MSHKFASDKFFSGLSLQIYPRVAFIVKTLISSGPFVGGCRYEWVNNLRIALVILENSCPKTSTVVSESSPSPDFSLQDEEMEELLTVILLYLCLHGVMVRLLGCPL